MIIQTDKKQRGLAAIEFAIVVPVMLFLMLATAEFGRVFYHYNTLTKAVQTGARYASKPLMTTNKLTDLTIDDLKEKIQKFVVYGNDSGTGLAVLDGFSDTNVLVTSHILNKTITIEAQYTYNFVILSDLPFIGYILPTLTLKSSVVTDTSLG